MKTVRNVKEWTDQGWLYSMTRIVGKKCLAHHVAIPKQKMHYRDVVAWRLRSARRELAHAVADERNLPGFT